MPILQRAVLDCVAALGARMQRP